MAKRIFHQTRLAGAVRRVFVCLLVSLLYSTPLIASKDIPVECNDVLNIPGGRYKLFKDLNCTGTGVTISADNVRLNLAGYTISGDRTGPGIVVNRVHGALISGGTVEGFTTGITLIRAVAATVRDMDIRWNRFSGIGDTLFSRDGQLIGNRLYQNGANGIDLFGSLNYEISGNTVENNSLRGIRLFFSPEGRVIGNIVSSNGTNGIVLSDSRDSHIQGNLVESNGFGCPPAFLCGLGIVIARAACATCAQGFGTTIKGNYTLNNVRAGIALFDFPGENTVFNNLVDGNTSLGNGVYDMFDQPLPCENTWKGNTFTTDNEEGADQGPGAGCIK